ncbi:MAG: SLBB domain-containing protein [Gemmatimonadales bacterium]
MRSAARFYLGHPDSLSSRLPGSDRAAEFELRPYDQVFVRWIPDFELPRNVALSGEFRFPGRYALRRKDERLREVIERAGGLTPTAFPGGFRLYRGGSLVNVDLEEVLDNPRHQDNLVLLPGDSMVVPEYNPVVAVEGAVTSPSTVLYRPGAGLDYYVDNAGGYARNADEGRVSVRYANGSARVKRKFLFFGSTPEPGPGSVVTVPVVPAEERTDVPALIADISQIIVSAATLAIVALRR